MTSKENPLTDEERLVYQQAVFNDVFDKQQPHENPQAYLIAGQPGAGKSSLTEKAEIECDIDSVVVNIDNYRKFHPHYDKYNQENDLTASGKTHLEASNVADAVLERATQNRNNIIIDGTLKDPEGAVNRIQELKEKGYEVHIRAICIRPEDSLRSIEERYKYSKEQYGYGRNVPTEVHDAAVNSGVISLQESIKQGKADSLTVQDRQGEILYQCAPNRMNETERNKAADKVADIYVEKGGRTLPLETPYSSLRAEKEKNATLDKTEEKGTKVESKTFADSKFSDSPLNVPSFQASVQTKAQQVTYVQKGGEPEPPSELQARRQESPYSPHSGTGKFGSLPMEDLSRTVPTPSEAAKRNHDLLEYGKHGGAVSPDINDRREHSPSSPRPPDNEPVP